MVVVPPGSVTLGLSPSDSMLVGAAQPQVRAQIDYAFAVGQHEVTVAEFSRFAEEAAYSIFGYDCLPLLGDGEWAADRLRGYDWDRPGFEQESDHPVVCVSWETAQAYVAWPSLRTGERYRLLTETEHEYANRANRDVEYWIWGEDEARACDLANVADVGFGRRYPDYPFNEYVLCDDGFVHTAPALSFEPNPFGLYGMTGNAGEWVQDCYLNSHDLTPTDGSALEFEGCTFRRVKGGSWSASRKVVRLPARMSYIPGNRTAETGFRIARDIQ